MKSYCMLLFSLFITISLMGCGNKEETTYFEATILEITDTYLLVEPLEDTPERKSADQITISISKIVEENSLEYLAKAEVGDTIKIGYHGGIAESYPAQIHNVFEIKLITKISSDKLPMEETSIDKIPEENINTLPGLTMKIKENTLSSTGLTIIVTNESEHDIMFGSYYRIEKEVDGSWQPLYYIRQEHDVGWNHIGYEVLINGSYEFEPTDWEWLYGPLEIGQYRFVKDAIVGSGKSIVQYYFSVEFLIP